MTPKPNLSRLAATSVFWSMARVGGDQVFNFIVFATLARFLSPAEFGLFVVALIYVEVGKIVAGAGLTTSLYRAPVLTPQIADTVFWGNLGFGAAVCLIGLMLSGPLATALGDPRAGPLIAALSLVIPISAAGASHMSRRLREFGHKALAVRSLLAGVTGGTLALLAAFNGYGVWALVVQRFTTEIIGTAVAWWSFRWRPGLEFSWPALKSQLGLGGTIMFSQLVLTSLARSQDIIIARMIGPAAVGVYRTAWKMTELISQGVINPFSTVSLPTLARLQHDQEAFARGYVKMVSASALISLPAIVGAGVLSNQIIPLMFGPRWDAAVPVSQILALMALPFALDFFADPALAVLKRSEVILRLALTKLASNLVFCIVAAPFGLTVFAAAYVTRAYLTMGLQLWLFHRATGVRPTRVLRGLAPPVVGAAVMAAVLMAAERTLPATPESSGLMLDVVRLAAFVAGGAAIYIGAVLLVMGPKGRTNIVGEVRGIMSRGRPS
jgi:O-antigen/teichoic acid export membrane protein